MLPAFNWQHNVFSSQHPILAALYSAPSVLLSPPCHLLPAAYTGSKQCLTAPSILLAAPCLLAPGILLSKTLYSSSQILTKHHTTANTAASCLYSTGSTPSFPAPSILLAGPCLPAPSILLLLLLKVHKHEIFLNFFLT